MDVIERKLTEIYPYEHNPRKNDGAVDYVANSIAKFGFKQPIVVDKDGVIIVGHTRYKAAQKLGLETAPVVVADDLDEEKARAYRLADNKTNELADWDFEMLDVELFDIGNIDMSLFGFEPEGMTVDDTPDAKYTEDISVVIDCENDEQAEMIFEKLTSEGYKCHISTL